MALDIVAFNGCSFISRVDNPGACPGDDWQLMSALGKTGRQGPKGDPGERGERGASAPHITAWRVNRDGYTVTPIMDAFSDGPAIELRGLFEQYNKES
jgi:hypothetical protein